MRIYTKDEALQRLKSFQGKRTVREFAADIGVSYAYLNSVYQGAAIGKRLREYLGLGMQTTKTITYFELNGAKGKE